MSVQFGLGILRLDKITIGYLQNVSLDISYEAATLYAGKHIHPIDIRVHTGNVSGNAEYADINAAGIQKLIGGTINKFGSIEIGSTDYPNTFSLLLQLNTDGKIFNVVLNKCQSTKFGMAFSRDAHLIPNFDFIAVGDANGVVGTITVEDVS